MKNSNFVFALFALALFSLPASVHAVSASIQEISPGTSVLPKNKFTFKIVPSGFMAQSYQLTDSFPGTTLTVNNIDQAGRLFWVPLPSDVGTHNISITAQDFNGNNAAVTQVVTVLPPPSVSIQSILPGLKIMPGTTLTFQVTSSGFTNPRFTVSDSVGGSSIANVSIGSSGAFSWTPALADDGEHRITVYANDSVGSSASASIDVIVGTGPSMVINGLSPGASVTLGQTLTFTATPMQFSPNAFSIVDTFSGSTVSNGNINISGQFSWTPSGTDAGTHTLTVTGTVGFFGKSASVQQVIHVLRPGETAPVQTVAATSTALTTAVAAASTGSNDAISALQKQILELNAKIAAQKGLSVANTVAATPVPASGIFTTYLYQGMEGDEVLRLQKVLAQQGFFSAEPNGTFGPLTVAAVKKFQAARSLSALGVVGPATRAALNALSDMPETAKNTESSGNKFIFENFLKWGDENADVMELQKKLKALGFFTGEASGYFGPATYAAVVKLQVAHGLDPKGHVGPGTRAVLNK